MSIENIRAAVRNIPDFPKPGIMFKDITPLLQDKDLFAETIDLLASHWHDNKPDYIVSVESRGFIFGAALAYKLGCGMIPVRKKGKLPFKTIEESYQLEYGEAVIEVHEDALDKGRKVIIIDDLLATGGTAAATVKLLKKLNADIIGIEFIIELAALGGRSVLGPYKVNTLIMVD